VAVSVNDPGATAGGVRSVSPDEARPALEQLAQRGPDAPTRRAAARLLGLLPAGVDPATGEVQPPTPPTRHPRGYLLAGELNARPAVTPPHDGQEATP
jgi:hypothetical protein